MKKQYFIPITDVCTYDAVDLMQSLQKSAFEFKKDQEVTAPKRIFGIYV